MTEKKKGLRIAAGIIMLVMTVLSITVQIATFYLNGMHREVNFFAIYWSSIIVWIVSIATAVFIICRMFKGAGIARCVGGLLTLYSVVANIIGIFTANNISRQYIPVSCYVVMLFSNLCALAATVLLIIGYFRHDRRSKKLFTIAAILCIVTDVILSPTATTISAASLSSSSNQTLTMALTYFGTAILFNAPGILALFLLAAYFGAQGSGAEAPRYVPQYGAAGYAPPQYAPQYMPPRQDQGRNYAPQYAPPQPEEDTCAPTVDGRQQYPGRYDHPGDNGQN